MKRSCINDVQWVHAPVETIEQIHGPTGANGEGELSQGRWPALRSLTWRWLRPSFLRRKFFASSIGGGGGPPNSWYSAAIW